MFLNQFTVCLGPFKPFGQSSSSPSLTIVFLLSVSCLFEHCRYATPYSPGGLPYLDTLAIVGRENNMNEGHSSVTRQEQIAASLGPALDRGGETSSECSRISSSPSTPPLPLHPLPLLTMTTMLLVWWSGTAAVYEVHRSVARAVARLQA